MAAAVGNDKFLTDLDVRIWLRDNDPNANLLLADYEFSPEEIRTAMTLAADYWNEQPPNIGCYDYTHFPWRSNLLKGTSANLLFIAAHRFRRNALKYNAGGLSVGDQDKHKEYDEAGARLWEEFKVWVAQMKRAINIERGFAVIS
jgi:hypothetical protein